ncbi:MMPL family transporter [Nocardia salmonicida]|uniref:MMPL family transporter n=1 Tax=Nocardia salmonicida TaxID=53431 RepID=UPI0033F8010B
MSVSVAQRPTRILLVTLLVFLAALAVELTAADHRLAGGAADPSADSALVARAVESVAPQADPNLFLLIATPKGADDQGIAAAARRLVADVAGIDGVAGVVSAWTVPLPALKADDGSSALVIARILGDEGAQDLTLGAVRQRVADAADLEIRVGGPVAVRAEVQSTIKTDLLLAELVALPLVLLVLLWVFGGVLAALLPVAVGVFSIVVTNAGLKLLSQFVEVSVFSQNLTTAVGLGLAIDYALLMVRRFREELAASADVDRAITATVATAGRTVLFSAATISAVLAALVLFPMYFLRSFAYAGVLVVAASTLAVLVCLPAALRLLGTRIGGRATEATSVDDSRWARSTRVVLARPHLFALVTTAVLVALAIPFGSVVYGTVDDRQLPPGAQIRDTHETLRSNYSAGALPLASIEIPAGSDPIEIGRISTRLAAMDGVLAVAPPPLRADPRVSALPETGVLLVSARPGIEPVTPEGQHVVDRIQQVARAEGLRVGGDTATLLDTKAAIGRIGPYAVAIVILVALISVFLLTGSVVLAAASVAVNGLSLTASLGAIVLIFQQGHLAGLLGFTPTGTIDCTLPILVVCIAFGLSMDYGVFVLARLTEEHRAGLPHDRAVVEAIARTGGTITSAAIILTIVLAAIGASRVAATKMIGIGVALAAGVDAGIVRLILVPAVLGIMGARWTWWSPAVLRRISDRFGWEESGPPAVLAPAGEPEQARTAGQEVEVTK